MTIRLSRALLLVAGAALVSGCVPMLAANVAGAAVDVARGKPVNNEGSAPLATQVCTARAQQYGAVHIIDTDQRTPSRIVVYGTVSSSTDRRSFKCAYGTKITAFALRTIPPPN